MNCVFCERITNREYDRCEGFFDVVSFEPLNPVVPGHRLFVPRMHVRDAAEVVTITAQVMEAAAAHARRVGDCNIITSVGSAATQTVFHLHIHVVPRAQGDGLPLPWTPQQEALRENR